MNKLERVLLVILILGNMAVLWRVEMIHTGVEKWGNNMKTKQESVMELKRQVYNMALSLTPTPTMGTLIIKNKAVVK